MWNHAEAQEEDGGGSGPVFGVAPASNRAWWRWPVLPALLAVLAGTLWFAFLLWPRPPTTGSADAGFARDMSRHHDQAVEMASTVHGRNQDPVIRTLAYDILTTQQAQIGMMSGWLSLWGLPTTGTALPMTWMGHPVAGPMPGMAAADEVASLRTLPPDQMDAAFLRLMVRHHQGGVSMAEAGAAEADRAPVRDLARNIAAAQRAEIAQMQGMLTQRGLPPVADLPPSPVEMSGMEGMGHHGEGFAAGFGDMLRDALRYAPVTTALFAGGWLLIDLTGRQSSIDALSGFGSVRMVSVVMLLATAVLHAGLTPEHFRERTGYGVFFAGSTVAAAVTAAALAVRPSRAASLVGAAVALLLIVLWGLFRLVPPPGATERESVDLVGVVTKLAEAVALAACVLLWRRVRSGAADPVREIRTSG